MCCHVKRIIVYGMKLFLTELRHEVFFATKSEPHLTKIVQHVLHLNAEKSNKKNSDKTKKHVWDHWSHYRYLET
jgi:hypothetical protein